MKSKSRRLFKPLLTLFVALVLMLTAAVPSLAANPTVSMTVTAGVIAITNTQANWALGVVTEDAVVYYSATGAQNDTYAQVENTGTLAVDVELQGTDFDGATHDWTLAAAAGSEIYSLHANSEGTPTVYDVEVKSSVYGDLTTNLAVSGTWDWSMKFVAPSAFNAGEPDGEKDATVTLVPSEYV